MVEVVFGESAAGSLSIAMGKGRFIGGATGVILTHADGSKPTKQEQIAAQQAAAEQERQAWAAAVPMPGSRADVLCFPLALSVGAIDEEGIGPKRRAALSLLLGTSPGLAEETTEQLLKAAHNSLDTLYRRAGNGDAVRIWASGSPDETCGLYWVLEQLRPIGWNSLALTLVQLPEFEQKPDGTVVQYTSWGEVAPHRWGALARLGKPLPANLAAAMATRWRSLQEENMPLRAVLNGQLVSMPESLYDPFILREIDAEAGDFLEARVVGRVLGKYRFGIGDAWVATRIEQFIQQGMLEPVTQAGRDEPVYRRILRKCPRVGSQAPSGA